MCDFLLAAFGNGVSCWLFVRVAIFVLVCYDVWCV